MAEPILLAARAAAGMLGVTAALDRPLTAANLAARLGVGARRLGWLLDLLAADGVLRREGDLYRREVDLPATPAPGARLLASVLRRDTPLTLLETVGSLEAAALTCHGWIERVPPGLADQIVELTRGGMFLDAGCGDGAIAAAVIARQPETRIALIDRDLGRAKRLFSLLVTGIGGDLSTVRLPRGRVALLSNVIHTLTPEVAALVVRRVAGALEPGGTLIIREVALADDRSGPLLALAFGLSMALFSDAELPVPSRIAGWLAEAGLDAPPPTVAGGSVTFVATARREAAPVPYDE
jgi:hypothetical protein